MKPPQMNRLTFAGLLFLVQSLSGASVVQFSAVRFTVAEDTGQAEIPVMRTGDLGTVASVEYFSSDGTALAGLDYTTVNGTLTFAVGETHQTIAVPILNDGLVESLETFNVTLTNAAGGAVLGSIKVATINIQDNESLVQLECDAYWVCEDEGSVLIGIVRGGEWEEAVTLEYATADGTALSGHDYTAVSGTLTFAPHENLKLVTIPVLNDGTRELHETFRFYLTNAMAGVVGRPNSASIQILDNDPGVSWVRSRLWVHEEDESVRCTVHRGNDQLLAAFAVDYASQDATAVVGQDYTAVQGTLHFQEGQMEQTIAVPILWDDVAEQDEVFRIRLTNPTGDLQLGDAAVATITVCDSQAMEPTSMAITRKFEEGSLGLRIGGSVHSRFLAYFRLFPLDASTDLEEWTHQGVLWQSCASVEPLVLADLAATGQNHGFYRMSRRPFISPMLPPTGSYAVGKTSRRLLDPTRRNRFQVSANQMFMLHLWYPAVPRPGQEPDFFDEEPTASDPNWAGDKIDRVPKFRCYSFPHAPVALMAQPCPILLYSHGGAGDNHLSCREMAVNLASHGYVVASVDHWDAYGFSWDDGSGYMRRGDVTLDESGIDDRVRDLMFVLDELALLNITDPLLAGTFDLDRVAVSGMAYGGPSAGEFCRVDTRCRAAITFDYAGGNTKGLLNSGLQKPSFMFNATWNSTKTLFEKAGKGAYWVQVSEMEHNDFAAWYWYFWDSPATVERKREAWRAMHACILSFLDRYLRGHNDGLLDNDLTALSPRLINYQRR